MTLAELYVVISTKGVAAAEGDLEKLKEAAEKTAKAAEDFGTKATIAYAAATAAVTGFVRAGLQGTAEGEQLNLQFQFLSREIAGVFLPIVQQATDWVSQLVEKFQSLTGEQQDNILRWVEGGIAAAGVAKIMPAVISGISGATAAVKVLSAAFTYLGIASGGILPAIGLVVTGVTALLVGTKAGRDGLSRMWEALQPLFDAFGSVLAPLMEMVGDFAQVLVAALVPALEFVVRVLVKVVEYATFFLSKLLAIYGVVKDLLGLKSSEKIATKAKDGHRTPTPNKTGFEDVAASYKRIQSAGLRVDRIPRQQLSQLEQINKSSQATAEGIARLKPGMT